ncbi:MAG: sugar phosphate isomerase/epimerase family protein [Armatimonadota bacterium]
MLRIGVCTISYNTLPVEEALAIAAEAGALGVEVWGRDHLPADASAAQVNHLSGLLMAHELAAAAYGSYARAGSDEWSGERVAAMLDRVVDLGAPTVRVWAGATGSAEATPADWMRVTDALRRWGDLAAARRLKLVVERHTNTLTDFGDCARRLIDGVNHPAVRLNYQVPYPGMEEDYRIKLEDDLRLHLPVSAHIHLQNYRSADLQRVPLAEGMVDLSTWPPLLAEAHFDGWAVLEFLPEQSEMSLVELTRSELASLARLFKLSPVG